MIPVAPQGEPEAFDEAVRQPGRRAITELLGLPGRETRPGRPRKAVGRAGLKVTHLSDYWRACLDDLHQRYGGICAYLCIYIPRGVGSPTVDHYLGKNSCVKAARTAPTDAAAAEALEPVYEWSNYRLAAQLMNARKDEHADIIDPFEVNEGWFVLVFPSLEVLPAPGLSEAVHQRVQTTITRLKLNDAECRAARAEYLTAYLSETDPIPFSFLRRRSPFVAHELRRQGMLRAGEE